MFIIFELKRLVTIQRKQNHEMANQLSQPQKMPSK